MFSGAGNTLGLDTHTPNDYSVPMSIFDNTAEDVTAHEAEMQERMEPKPYTYADMWEAQEEAAYRAEMDADWWDGEPDIYAGTYSEE